MKFRNLLLGLFVAFSAQSNAQTWVYDSVALGAGYVNDVYYSMKNGASGPAVSNTNWHLGFEMVPGGPGWGGVSVIANHTLNGVKVYSLHKTGSSFAGLTGSDTSVKTLLYTSDTSWDWGAMNVNTDGSPFDYGWGKYSSTTHHVEGDSLYLITFNGEAYKMLITHYHSHPLDSIYYAFHIAKFDNTGDYLDTLWRKPNYVNKNFAYFDIVNNAFLNREPDHNTWDVQFTRYIEYVALGPGPLQPYPVTGVLSNMGVMVADVRNVNPDTTHSYNAYARIKDKHAIGSDWKSFNMTTFQYDIDTTATFFVQTVDSAIYQVKFTGFTSSSGKIVFAKRMLAQPVAVKEVTNNISSHMMVPNPAADNSDFVMEAKESANNSRLFVTDMTGKVVMNGFVNIEKGLNAFRINTSNFAAGTYIVTVTNGDWKVAEKLMVQH